MQKPDLPWETIFKYMKILEIDYIFIKLKKSTDIMI